MASQTSVGACRARLALDIKIAPCSRRRYSSIINIPRADVYRFGAATQRSTPVFRDLEWTIKANESWAVVGTGSGEKSTVFDMLMGHLRIHPAPPPPGGLYPFLSTPGTDPQKSVSIVSFAHTRAVGGAFYDYTARYGAVREEDRITLRESMFPEMVQDLKSQTRVKIEEEREVDYKLFEYLVDKMGLAHLLDLPRIALSNGQTRRARILKALLAKPRLLLLDEPLTGLDVQNRATALDVLHELHSANDPHIILGLRMHDPVPQWITHLVIVNEGIVKTGPKDSLREYQARINEQAKAARDEQLVLRQQGKPLVELKNVSVTYGPRKVLKNITWTIVQGGRYHLQGSNGSGKTTLLSLLTGDHPQSYTQLGPERHLLLFGSPRSKIATPTLHKKVGVVTPELFDAFPRRAPGMTVWEVVGTGWEGGFVSKGVHGLGADTEMSGEEEVQRRAARVREVVAALGPTAWDSDALVSPPASPASSPAAFLAPLDSLSASFAQQRFRDLPVGAQRMVLLMRAVVAYPPVVLLDEVWSGMDGRMVRAARRYLRNGGGVKAEQAVVVITHLEDEVPWGEADGVERVRLDEGVLRSVV
ncbi:P-loop containing nucleoside triphosphate hydrolase protein [Roridomyces roridus]|uniref:P-loop containing nucleoside triphosphate hydrolase protein n=1 Tax=Roridomyces roridus TaxID=1738132 RepID=A0AAD7BMP0_9AGAR|nr:P-loop containing nucleoside triphosphate hydrolase protein [Roridomyces roridus]